MGNTAWSEFVKDAGSLITPHEQTRAGFIALAFEKNKKGTPYIEEAKVLKIEASKAKTPGDLLGMDAIIPALLAASGVSEKAGKYFEEEDEKEIVRAFINEFLEPAGLDFVDELIYRFILTKGDALGGVMRNLAGKLGEKKFIRTLISSLSLRGIEISWRDRNNNWEKYDGNLTDIEDNLNAISWESNGQPRVLILNTIIPIVSKNIDLSLLNCKKEDLKIKKNNGTLKNPANYIALGELKGGIDPAGADEHWKTANTALERIRSSFLGKGFNPFTFFIGAAIEKKMSKEIFSQLSEGILACAGNLTLDEHLVGICRWLIGL